MSTRMFGHQILMKRYCMCEREPGNIHDPYALAVEYRNTVVGHVPRIISAVCSMFLLHGGSIECRVTGGRRYSEDLPQGGLELPCVLKFIGPSAKLKSLLDKAPIIKGYVACSSEPFDEPPSKKGKLVEHSDTSCSCSSGPAPEPVVWINIHGYALSSADRRILVEGNMLNDMTINSSQAVLKHQFSIAEGLNSSLLQHKKLQKKIDSGLQVIHSRGNHWILASNIGCADGCLNVYDSVYASVDDDTSRVLRNLFNFQVVNMIDFQKQKGGTDCGLFAIAAATSILHKHDNTLNFCQNTMRQHTLYCLEQCNFTIFP